MKALWRRPAAVACFGERDLRWVVIRTCRARRKVVVIHSGFFGERIAEMARRYHADLIELTAPLGQIVPLEQVEETLLANPDIVLVGVVHAETSTGVRYPVSELGELIQATCPDALLLADFVTSLGGEEVSPDEWGVDYAWSYSQKSPATLGPSPFSERPPRSTGSPAHPVLLRYRTAREVLCSARSRTPHDAHPEYTRP
jgi:alanine-glyoxylate transaminase/serine-glyoxylate transaminase/serine-pyruvate transaminase